MKNKIYAVYKDDTFICMGTYKEISDYMGIGVRTLQTYKSKPYKYKYIIFEVGDEDE